MKFVSASSIFRLSVILPLVGAILGALIGMWVEEGIVPLIIGAAWGGAMGFRAAKADEVLAHARFEILRLWGGVGYPKSLTLISQVLGAGLIGWLADVYALKFIAILLGLGCILAAVTHIIGRVLIMVGIFVGNIISAEKISSVFRYAVNSFMMFMLAYIYWLAWPAICSMAGALFANHPEVTHDWMYRLIAAYICLHLGYNLAKTEYCLIGSDEERKRTASIFRQSSMLWLALFVLYAHFPEIPTLLYFWWVWT